MDSKPLYRRKRFWFLGVIMVTFVVVGGRYAWELVPSAAYRELVREAERSRETQPAPEERVVYTDEPFANVSTPMQEDIFQSEDPAISLGLLNRSAYQFGFAEDFREYSHPFILKFGDIEYHKQYFEDGNVNWVRSQHVQSAAMSRQYFISSDDFPLEHLDLWAKQYIEGMQNSILPASSIVPWCIARADWVGNGELATLVLDRYLQDIYNDPSFYGKPRFPDSPKGGSLPYVMIALNHCRIDNPRLWNRIGEMLDRAEEKQRQVTPQFHEKLMQDTEDLLRGLEENPPEIKESAFSFFMDGVIIETAQTIYTPVYRQKARDFAGHFSRGNYEEALKNLRAIDSLREKLFWERSPALEVFDRLGVTNLEDKQLQVALLEIMAENRQSLMAITPREYATNVYMYLQEGTLAEGMEVFELEPFTPITRRYHVSKEYAELFDGSEEQMISLEEIPDDFAHGHIRKAFSENLSERITPGPILIQRRQVAISDPMAIFWLRWRDDADTFKSMVLEKPPVTLWYGDFGIFPDLETIRETLAPEITTPEQQEN